MYWFPGEAEQGDGLPSCFSSHTISKYSFPSLCNAVFVTFFCFLLVISLFKMAPKCSTEVLSSVPRWKKAVMCLMEKIHVR